MNLHSCQLTKRKRRLPMANIQKKCVRSAVFKGHRAWGLPSTKAETEAFRFFFQQLPNPWFFIFHVGCMAHMIQSSFFPPLSPLSLAFLFIFWSPFPPASLSHIHFPFPSHFSEYFAFGSLYFLKPQSSLFTVLAHIVKLFSPFISMFLPGQPGTGALGDPSIFQGEEMTVFWWLICWPNELESVTLQTRADYAWSAGFPFPQQASLPLHWSASCKAEICVF